jgi:hypothetical protein
VLISSVGRLRVLNFVMENYYKGKNVEEELDRNKIPIKDLPDNFLWMQVSNVYRLPLCW